METKFNFNSAICTSLEQSRRLLALGLKKETADMWYPHFAKTCPLPLVDEVLNSDDIPAWSLHRLMCLCFNSGATHVELFEDDDAYEILIYKIEIRIKEGYFPKEYLA